MSFTNGALLVNETRTAVESITLHNGNWKDARKHVLENNLMQLRSENTRKRVWGEVSNRLRTLTPEQFEIVRSGQHMDIRLMLWLAMCKRYRLIHEFARDVIQLQFEQMIYALPRSAWDSFFNEKSQWFPEMERVVESTRKKQRQIVFRALHEAQLLEDHKIVPTVMSTNVVKSIIRDDPNHLYIYPLHPANVLPV